jgi:hypothetical protein
VKRALTPPQHLAKPSAPLLLVSLIVATERITDEQKTSNIGATPAL